MAHVEPSESHVKVMEKLVKAAPKPTNAEASAVTSYSGSNYQAINTKLRHDPNSPVTPTIKGIDSFLAKSTIPEDVTLYRKVSGEYAKILKSIVCDGCSFIDRGFISTSPYPGIWLGNLTMVIKVPAGSKGAAIKHLSNHSSENEVLLPRGTKLNVTKLDLANNRIEVEVEQEHMKKAAA